MVNLRVLQLIDSLSPGGAERMAVNLANDLANNIDASFLCTTRSEGTLKEFLNDNVQYFFLNKKSTFDVFALNRFITFIRKHNINIIHAHSSSYFLATLVKGVINSIKIVWHDHYGNRPFLSQNKSFILKLCSISFHSILSVNVNLKQWAEQRLKCKKVFVIPNFVTVQLSEKRVTTLKGIKGKKIACIANLRAPKNHVFLIKSFSEVVKHHPEWTLHLIGVINNDDYSKEVQAKIALLELSNHVFLYDSCHDIQYILKQSTIAVLASVSEGLPLVLLEYGLAKLAVVATNVGDCNKIISNKAEGILVESNNIKDYTKALLYYINNTIEAKKAGFTLYKKIQQNYSPAIIIEQIITIYKSI